MAINTDQEPRHVVDFKDEKIALCRCWQSKKFPFCDGSRRAYNEQNQECLGPVIVMPGDVE